MDYDSEDYLITSGIRIVWILSIMGENFAVKYFPNIIETVSSFLDFYLKRAESSLSNIFPHL